MCKAHSRCWNINKCKIKSFLQGLKIKYSKNGIQIVLKQKKGQLFGNCSSKYGSPMRQMPISH